MHEPFVDIHCHILPGLDDGAATLDEALAMAQMAIDDGIGTIVATPHQLGNHSGVAAGAILRAVEQFQQELDRRRWPLKILPGADVRIEPDLVSRIRQGQIVTSANRRKHILLELPHEVFLPLDRLLAELASAQIVGILSHPERNKGILRQPSVLPPLIERGCLLQVTAGSMTGTFGPDIQRFSESLLEQDMVHFVSTDAHSTGRRCPILSEAFERISELVGERKAIELCCRNPHQVALGRMVSVRGNKIQKPAWTGWFKRTFSSGLAKV